MRTLPVLASIMILALAAFTRAARPEKAETYPKARGTGEVAESVSMNPDAKNREIPEPREKKRIPISVNRMLEQHDTGRNGYRDLLRKLSRLGSKEALDTILRLLVDPEIDFPHRAAVFSDALMPFRDPRIAPAATIVLQRNLDRDRDSWIHTKGYLELIAAKGGLVGEEFVASLFRHESPQVAQAAAQQVHLFRERARKDRLLEFAANNARKGGIILTGMARWKDPAVTLCIRDLAFDLSVSSSVRQAAYRALGENIAGGEVSGFMARWWSSGDVDSRNVILHGIRGLASNLELDHDRVGKESVPLLRQALLDRDPRVRSSALTVIRSGKTFALPGLKPDLERLLSEEVSPTERIRIRRALKDLAL